MIYLIRSYGKGSKSILKVGFTDVPERRLSSYFYHNPFSEVLGTKEGDELYEGLLHLYLSYLGYSFKIDGKLDEWYLDKPEVIEIFDLSLDDFSDLVWKSRDKVFDRDKLKSVSVCNWSYRLFEFLYERHKDEFVGERFKVSEDGKIQENDSFLDIDGDFWKIYSSFNPPEIELPDIYKKENLDISSDFLDNHFYTTGIFKEKLKMYCEFCDTYKDNPEIMDIINYMITVPRFRQFYEYFGTRGCSSKGYEEKPLLEAWGNDSKEEKLKKEIYLTFKSGDRYSSKELKSILSDIYKSLGITRTAKAIDLGNYFKLTKTNITLPNKTVVNGFKLESL